MIILYVTASLISFGVAFFVAFNIYKSKFKNILQKSSTKAEDVKKKGVLENNETSILAKKEVAELKIKEKIHLEEELSFSNEELHQLELQLEYDSQRNDTLKSRLDGRREDINQRYTVLKQKYAEIKNKRKQKRDLINTEIEKLETAADIRKDEIISSIENRIIEKSENEAKAIIRNYSDVSESDFTPLAKRIIGISIGRIGHLKMSERPGVYVVGTKRNYKSFLLSIGGDPETLDKIFQIPLIISETEENVTIRFDTLDTVKREIARRILEKCFALGKPAKDLEKLFLKKVEEMESELLGLGRKAFKVVGLKPKADKEIIKLLGRLQFRTSYTQNQWVHSVEAAQLAGLMAHELKLNVTVAKRAALLHDIGKALTHKVEGSHAIIGSEFASKYGESEVIVNAIASHHGDVPGESLYARIVMACDALSGGRPGARREMVETYFDRIKDLEKVALDFKGVKDVFAVQAGRELRVIVDNNTVKENQTEALAAKIVDKISNEVIFPGRIKVTVIRKFSVVEYAR
jgi:ribonucrease Y